jgi:hypothetical protein
MIHAATISVIAGSIRTPRWRLCVARVGSPRDATRRRSTTTQSTDRLDAPATPAAVGASDYGAPVQPAPTGSILAAALMALAALAADPALSTGLAPDVLDHLRAAGAAHRASEQARTDAHASALSRAAAAEAQAEALGADLAEARRALAATEVETATLRDALAERDAEDAAAAAEIAAMTAAMTRIGERLSRRQVPAAPSGDTDAGDDGLAPRLTVVGRDGEDGRPSRRADTVRDRAASAGETAVPPGAKDAGMGIG